MKANQTLRKNDEAVSPVIGVILMVAITVVLAAVVFVLVTNLSKNQSSSTPSIGFSQNNAAKTLTISSADPGTKWADLKITVSCRDAAGAAANTATLAITSPAPTTALADTDATAPGYLADPVQPAANTDTVQGNQIITVGCTGATAGHTGTVSVTYKPTNTALGSTYTFTW